MFFSKFENKEMVEMDRFVYSLSSDEVQTIERKSQESASTMKFTNTTVEE